MLPPAALRPSAQPFCFSGKKHEMLVIDEAKLPPPRPASAAQNSIVPNDVDGSLTAQASARVGTTSSSAETTVQLRPPKRGTAKV